MDVLVVVDLQNDFVSGTLGNEGNDEIIAPIEKLVDEFDGEIIFTRDTHNDDYMKTLEGDHLPIKHCVKGTDGWKLVIDSKDYKLIDKPSFGSYELVDYIVNLDKKEKVDTVYMVGICTDICVLSNAIMIKNALLDTEVTVYENLCKGTNEKKHKASLEAMDSCQVNIEKYN